MYRSRFQDGHIDRLFQAILALRTEEDCYRFFEDLCTVGEIQAMAQRFQAAEMLHHGFTYEEIAARTGMSSATISRIKRCLQYGADGYRLAIDRLPALEGATGRDGAGSAGGEEPAHLNGGAVASASANASGDAAAEAADAAARRGRLPGGPGTDG